MFNPAHASNREADNRLAPILMGLVVVLVLVLASIGVAMELYGRAAQRNADDASTLLLRERTAYGLLADMQTAQRGYVITRNPSFLAPYTSAEGKLPATWAEMRTIASSLDDQSVAGTQPLMPLVSDVQAQANSWQQNFAVPLLSLVRQGNTDEARNMVANGTGEDLFNRFRDASFTLNTELNNRFHAYSADLNRIRQIELSLLIGVGVLAIGTAMFAVVVTRRESALQAQATRAALGESERLQAMVETMPVAVRLVSAPRGDIVLQNRAAEQIFPSGDWNKLRPEERPDFYKLATPDGMPIPAAEMPGYHAVTTGERVEGMDLVATVPGRGERRLLISSVPLKDQQGTVSAAIVVMQDVTLMRELDARKDEFIATAAHELRNPLAALSGYIQLQNKIAQRGDLPPTIVKYIHEMTRISTRINSLVELLLDASRVSLGRLVLDKSRVNMVEVAHAVATTMRAEDRDEHSIVVQTHQGETNIPVEADATRIEQVVTNLVGNALRYSPRDTPVAIRICDKDGAARVEVVDRGPGVPENERESLFQRYYQSMSLNTAPLGEMQPTSARQRRHGLGLGLYLSKEIVQAHGGQIGMDPNPEGGSIFWFTLPLAR